ncbi:MAG: AraC family transcriptional regulator ligand-binding domain-containing protein [Gammaproteobacteria bacterium]|nr:AraC family transcriptional regulator ligand-binding domain-containing protein [Gammaproteobacteria bacterium]
MSKSGLLVPARYYARLVDILAQDRVDLAAVLGSLHLPLAILTEPEAMLKVSQVDRLVETAYALSGRSDLAFELGRMLSASAHSFVGFGMLNCETLDQALRFEAQYFRLVMPSFRMRYTSGPDYGEMHFTPAAALSPLSLVFHVEAIGMAALREVSDLTGGHCPPCRLDLSIAEPRHRERYRRELTDVRVRFAAEPTPSVRLRLEGNPRERRLAMADSHARKVAEERCRALVQRVARGGQFADWVAMTLREVSDDTPSLAELAPMLNISTRTLNRYLEREGTSFRELSNRVRHELACERLAGGNMSVTDVAYSLGYNDRSNFGRAFRARAGYSPSEHLTRSVSGRTAPEQAGHAENMAEPTNVLGPSLDDFLPNDR